MKIFDTIIVDTIVIVLLVVLFSILFYVSYWGHGIPSHSKMVCDTLSYEYEMFSGRKYNCSCWNGGDSNIYANINPKDCSWNYLKDKMGVSNYYNQNENIN